MRSHFRIVLRSVIGISILEVLLLLLSTFNVGGHTILEAARYSLLILPLAAGALSLVSVNSPFRQEGDVEPWAKRERQVWILIGCGYIGWAIGEAFWRYYVEIGQAPFPSLADVGFSSFPPLVFAGLILQPSSKNAQKRVFLILDSLIVMGALLSIAWFLLLGHLAQASNETALAKFLGLYYPVTDIVLLSCIAFLLLRGSSQLYRTPARRISLLLLGIGLCLFSAGDFVFNVLENLGAYHDGTWLDLSWPLGMVIMATGAYVRRFLPNDSSTRRISEKEGIEDNSVRLSFGPAQLLPYLLLIILFVVLGINILSTDNDQQSIRPVLLIVTLIVIGLVIVRQIITMQENETLMKEQEGILKKLEKVYHEVECRKIELESGIGHLKEIQTRLANGDVRARAQIMGGDLWPLATGLNLMADRMMRSEHSQKYAQKLVRAVNDLSLVLENSRGSRGPIVIPTSCLDVPELHHLLTALGLRSPVGAAPQVTPPSPPMFQRQPSASPGTQNSFPRPAQRATPYHI